jgi:ATP-dependent protease HslVU (ClpYQ) peptidase subunit
MSCVIGLKSGGVVYIGSDGAATTEDGDIRPIRTKKIIRNREYLIGFAGSVRTGQLIEPHNFKPPENIYDLVEQLRIMFYETGCLVTTEVGTSLCQSCFIISHQGVLWEILSDFQLNQIEGDFTAIGSGTPYAFAAMDALNEQDLSPSEKIVKALEITSRYQATVRPPYYVEKHI